MEILYNIIMKIRECLRKIVVVMIAILVGVVPCASANAAIDEETLQRFAEINVLFYDPSGSMATNYCSIGTGDCVISGSTRDEKLWSGLRHVGFTPEQAAGILGNIVNEGGTPTRQEQSYINARRNGCRTLEGEEYDIFKDITNGQHHGACMESYSSSYHAGGNVVGIGLGFIQWTSHGRRLGYLSVMESLGLMKYFEGDAYLTYGSMSDSALKAAIEAETGSDGDYWALWCAAIKYIYTEMSSPSYNAFFSQGSVAEYAAYAARRYEVCAGCQPGELSYNKRVADAERFYQMYLDGGFDAVENGATPNTPNRDEATGDETASEDTTDAEGATNQSAAASIQRSGSCSIPYNVTTAEDALKIVQQFIIDTNTMYGTSYYVPTDLEIANRVLLTPNSDERVNAIPSVRADWISRGIIAASDTTAGCWGGSYCGQCTALSGWFTGTMTGYTYGGGDGGMVVTKLQMSNPGIQVTNVPTPFSVFSERSGSVYGHTGIVVGDFGDGTYLSIENNIQSHKLRAMRRTLSSFVDKDARFAVMVDKVKMSHIGQQ